MSLKFLHLHLHGLIRSSNLELGKDSDTGGQTQYVLQLVKSLANTSEVKQVDLVTRLINDSKVDDDYSKDAYDAAKTEITAWDNSFANVGKTFNPDTGKME